MPIAHQLRKQALLSALFLGACLVALAGASEPAVARGACDELARPGEKPRHFVRSLSRGDVGCFRRGRTYRAPYRQIEVRRRGITLRTQPGGRRARLVGRLWIRRGATGATVRGLKLNGRNRRGKPGIAVNGRRATFARNVVTNGNSQNCFVLGSRSYGIAKRTVIRRNRIHHCGRLPATNHHHGIYVARARDTVIRDNVIHDNADRGVQLYPDADRTLVTGNVIAHNGEGIIFSGDSDDRSTGNTVTGNVISHSRIRFNVESHWPGPVGVGNTVTRNCLWAPPGTRRGEPVGSGIQEGRRGFTARLNRIGRPRYLAPEQGDYRLRAGSECRWLER